MKKAFNLWISGEGDSGTSPPQFYDCHPPIINVWEQLSFTKAYIVNGFGHKIMERFCQLFEIPFSVFKALMGANYTTAN